MRIGKARRVLRDLSPCFFFQLVRRRPYGDVHWGSALPWPARPRALHAVLYSEVGPQLTCSAATPRPAFTEPSRILGSSATGHTDAALLIGLVSQSAKVNPTHVPWVNNATSREFCFSMIGRANIEGSKSNVAMNDWLPQADYLRGNFSDTSS